MTAPQTHEMTMVERAARAMSVAQDSDPEKLCYQNEPYYGPLKPHWQWNIADARAVLLAIREPTEAMKKAAADVHTHEGRCATDYGHIADADDMGHAYSAAIDAALTEKE